jgi:hypothetical protein
MAPLDRVIEGDRKIRVLRQRAKPFAIFANDTADVPVWQLERDQRDRRIGPGAAAGVIDRL